MVNKLFVLIFHCFRARAAELNQTDFKRIGELVISSLPNSLMLR